MLVSADEPRLIGVSLRSTAHRLPPGSYLVTLELEGYREARYPVLLSRGRITKRM